MTLSSKDQIQGTLHEAKGTVKEQVGKATNNPTLVDKGTERANASKCFATEEQEPQPVRR